MRIAGHDIVLFRTADTTVGAYDDRCALLPDEGYAVGWKRNADCQRLAAAGYQVIAAPADGFYLDMATTTDWYEPGTCWAGSISAQHIAQYDLDRSWSAAEKSNAAGIEACLWTEHVADRATMRRLLGPRLDGFADVGW